MRETSTLYRLLGDEARLRLLRVLRRERLNVTELTGILGLAQSGVSRHLGLLKDAGLVVEEKDAGFTYYRVAPAISEDERKTLWSALEEQFARAESEPAVRADEARLQKCCGSARKTSIPRRRRYAGRAATRAWPQLGGVVAGARIAPAAAARRGSRLRRGLPHDRSRALRFARHRRRPIPDRARAGQGVGASSAGFQRDLEAGRARKAADPGRER